MGLGRLQDPAVMGRLVSSEGVGPLSLEKRADAIDGVLKALHTAYKHPTAAGALIGAGIGAATSPKGEDRKDTIRNTIGSLLGGAMSGAIVGDAVNSVKNPNESLFHTVFDRRSFEEMKKLRPAAPFKEFITSMLTAGKTGPRAGRELLRTFAPTPAPPESLVGLLGNKKRYSDSDLVRKYNEEKPTGEREQKFVTALRDLYSHADHAKGDPLSTKDFLKKNLHPVQGLASSVFLSAFLGQKPRDAALRSLPAAVLTASQIGKNIRENYIDSGVVVKNRDEAKTRASFNDTQLRRLLKGLRVEQVQEHVIK